MNRSVFQGTDSLAAHDQHMLFAIAHVQVATRNLGLRNAFQDSNGFHGSELCFIMFHPIFFCVGLLGPPNMRSDMRILEPSKDLWNKKVLLEDAAGTALRFADQ